MGIIYVDRIRIKNKDYGGNLEEGVRVSGRGVYRGFLSVGVMLLLSSSLFASLVNVQEISVSFPIAFFYEGASGGNPGYFHITNASTIVGNIQTQGASGYDYGLSATVTVDQCDLKQDNSTGGWAKGDFYGGAVMTVTGDLWDVSDPCTLLVDNDIILQAQMVPTSSETWVLQEVGNPRDIDASIDFNPIDGGLNSGIDLGNGNTLVIGDFQADFSFPNTQPMNPTSFGMMDYFAMASTLQMTAVPEPSTLILLTIGGLSILRKKRT